MGACPGFFQMKKTKISTTAHRQHQGRQRNKNLHVNQPYEGGRYKASQWKEINSPQCGIGACDRPITSYRGLRGFQRASEGRPKNMQFVPYQCRCLERFVSFFTIPNGRLMYRRYKITYRAFACNFHRYAPLANRNIHVEEATNFNSFDGKEVVQTTHYF